MRYIFEEIIETRAIFRHISESESTVKEKEHVAATVKDIFHHELVDLVLDELDEEKKIIFLSVVDDETQHKSMLGKLKEWISDFDEKIIKRACKAEENIMNAIGLTLK